MPLSEWGARLTESFQEFSREYGKPIQLQIEPGRFVVAECGYLVADVQNLKETPDYNFAIVNTGFNHNPRPAIYGAYHPIEFVSHDGRQMSGAREYVIAGYLCESGDVFTRTEDGSLAPRTFPELKLGDLMVQSHIGAYSHAMKSDYNSMNFPPSILLRPDGSRKVIERRGTLEDVMRRENEAY
jgi:diaminopimelate decarboxylase